MKGYICAILLVTCGMAHFAYFAYADSAMLVQGGCLFGSRILSVGGHTAPPCMRLACGPNGQITLFSCPPMPCNPGMRQIGFQPETEGLEYPDCCPQAICEGIPYNRKDNHNYLLKPYALP